MTEATTQQKTAHSGIKSRCEEQEEKPRILIVIEGGLVQEVIADSLPDAEVYVVDYDTEGALDDEVFTLSSGVDFYGRNEGFSATQFSSTCEELVAVIEAASEEDSHE